MERITSPEDGKTLLALADECLYELEAPIKRVAALDVPMPYAPVLEQAVVPTVERIRAAVLEVCG